MRLACAASLALILALPGCASFDPAKQRTLAVAPTSSAQLWRGLPVETGQIIVNEHPGAMALFLSFTARRFAPYIHAGIVVVEEGEPYVYEAMGAILPLPWRNPNAGMGGGVRRVKLESFLLRGGIVAIYSPDPGVDREALAGFARARERERKPFDGRYDASDPTKYYCVEFVARALEAAGAAPIRASPATRNPSVRVALRWVEIDTPEFLLAGDLVDQERRVALVSGRFTEHEIERYFELKRELHRRFTEDQRVGNVMYWRLQGLRLRPGVDRYYEVGVANDVAPALLADEMFGSLPAEEAARVAGARY
jgi:hypothetical protein